MLNLFKKNILGLKASSKKLLFSNKHNKFLFTSTNLSQIRNNNIDKVKIDNSFKINPDNLDDYVVIGAEIFKNAFHESVKISNNANENENILQKLTNFTQEVKQTEVYMPKLDELEYPELPDRLKTYSKRPFLDGASLEVRHMFTPSWREKYEYLEAKDMYKFSYIGGTRESHNEAIFERMDYAKGFQKPFTINNVEIEKCIDNIGSYIKKAQNTEKLEKNWQNLNWKLHEVLKININKIIDEIPHSNHSTYANLCMQLFYTLDLNVKEIWVALEQEILNNLHHLNNIDISKIYFISRLNSPKFTSNTLKDELENVITSRLETMNLEDFLHICIGFRLNRSKDFNIKVMNSIIKMKTPLLEGKPHENLGKLLLAHAANKPMHYGVKTFYPNKDNVNKFVLAFEKELNDNIMKMSPKEVARTAHAMYLLKYEDVDLFVK